MITSAAASARARPARLSLPVALGLIVLGASAIHVLLALQIASPWIVPDEIRYAELAKSLGDGNLPAIRGEVTFEFGLGYPLLLAPIWALFNDVAVAYTVGKGGERTSCWRSLRCPRTSSRGASSPSVRSVAAALSVSIPSLLYAGMLMTEVALYPTFVLALLAIAVAVERPTPATQLAALGAIALASSVKVLALSLLLGYIAGLLSFHWLDTRRRKQWLERLRAYRTTWLVLGGDPRPRHWFRGCRWAEPDGRSRHLRDLPRSRRRARDAAVDALPPRCVRLLHRGHSFRGDRAGHRRRAPRVADRRVRLFAVMCLTMSAPVFAVVAAYSSNPSPPRSAMRQVLERTSVRRSCLRRSR